MEKLIIVEGPQGVGKTTITDYLRHSISYSNLYRMCGTSDITVSGKKKSEEMYNDLLEYIKKMQNNSINLIFDRTFFTEEIYCRLGKKEYNFTDIYLKLLDEFSKLNFDIYYITLYLNDTSLYEKRLNRKDKALYKGSEFDVQNSINQQNVYLELSNEIKEKYPNINVINIANDDDIDIKTILKEKIGY